MIEKISDFNRDKTRDKLISKINELVDAVNKLEERLDYHERPHL